MIVDDKVDFEEFPHKKISAEITLLLGSLAVSLIIIFAFTAPAYKQMKITEAEIGLMEKNIASKIDISKKISDFNLTYKNLSERNLRKINSLLPQKNNFEEHLASIDYLASPYPITINDFSVIEQKDGKNTEAENYFVKNDNLKIVKISFLAEGSFSSFMPFFNALEQNIPLINLNSLDITKKEDGGKYKKDDLAYEIEYQFYYLKN